MGLSVRDPQVDIDTEIRLVFPHLGADDRAARRRIRIPGIGPEPCPPREGRRKQQHENQNRSQDGTFHGAQGNSAELRLQTKTGGPLPVRPCEDF